MFNIEYSNSEKMFDDTQKYFKEIEGIEKFIELLLPQLTHKFFKQHI
jgi:hypothetical protein